MRAFTLRAVYDAVTRSLTGSRLQRGFPGNARLPLDGIFSSRIADPESQKFDHFPICTDALLTRYAGNKFERSQHAYRTQRAQIHIHVYALRERRDDPAPKTHTPRHTLLLTTLLH